MFALGLGRWRGLEISFGVSESLLPVLEIIYSSFPAKKEKERERELQENVTKKEQNRCSLFAFKSETLVVKARL